MPATAPASLDAVIEKLHALGQAIRTHRKSMKISATAAAEAAGMSRVTLHRIEKGEPSVTMGAYLNAMLALGLDWRLFSPGEPDPGTAAMETGAIPARIRLADYPQLKRLAWQVHGTDELTPIEARNIYERNERHLDWPLMSAHERRLIEALYQQLGRNKHGV